MSDFCNRHGYPKSTDWGIGPHGGDFCDCGMWMSHGPTIKGHDKETCTDDACRSWRNYRTRYAHLYSGDIVEDVLNLLRRSWDELP